jgi:hypothetical protein
MRGKAMLNVQVINPNDVTDISEDLLMRNGKLHLRTAQYYKELKWQDFRTFCHFYGRYGVPTIELIDFIKKLISDRDVMEIGSGAGDLGYHLGILMTDSKIQAEPAIKSLYKLMQQPPINYPEDVVKIDALDAVIKHKPEVVVASWITPYAKQETTYGSNPFGIREKEILDLVETFIIVGNHDVHHDKPIMQFKHEEYYFDWIVSRAKNQKNNRIYVWNKK